MAEVKFETKVTGLRELEKALRALGEAAGKKALRGMLVEVSKPMFQQARRNAEATGIRGFDKGALAAAMGRSTRLRHRGRALTGTTFIGPKSRSKAGLALWNQGRAKPATRLRHAHLVEFGSVNGPAQPYMRPAFDTHARGAVASMGRALRRNIDKQAAKHKPRKGAGR